MTTDSQATSANVEATSGRRNRRALAIKMAMVLVVVALVGLFVAQHFYHLGDQSTPCARHETVGVPLCKK